MNETGSVLIQTGEVYSHLLDLNMFQCWSVTHRSTKQSSINRFLHIQLHTWKT